MNTYKKIKFKFLTVSTLQNKTTAPRRSDVRLLLCMTFKSV